MWLVWHFSDPGSQKLKQNKKSKTEQKNIQPMPMEFLVGSEGLLTCMRIWIRFTVKRIMDMLCRLKAQKIYIIEKIGHRNKNRE